MRHQKYGQILIEFALTLPILLFMMLGAMEAGFLLIAKADQDRRTEIVAEWAADHNGESWNSIANKELPGCEVSVDSPYRDVVQTTSRCQYHPVVLVMWSGLQMSSRESAAVRSKDSPSTTPAASPSSS